MNADGGAPAPAAPPVPPPAASRLLVWALVVSQFGPPFMFSGVAVALPKIGAELQAGAGALGLVETLFLAGSLVFLLPVGRLADATDKTALYKLGLLMFVGSAVLIGCSSSLPLILALRALQGFASALFAVTGPAILAELVPLHRRGAVFGASVGAIYVGLTVGPLAAGWLVELGSWRAVFFGGALVILAGHLIVHRRLRSAWRQPPPGCVHVPSLGLLVSATGLLCAGSALLHVGTLAWVLSGGGLLLAAAFVGLQRRLQSPLLDLRLLQQNGELRRALATQLLVYLDAHGSFFLLSMFLQAVLHESARAAGQLIALGTLAMALLAPFAGRLADRYRPRHVARAGTALVLASASWACTFGAGTSGWTVAAMLALQCLGFALFSSPNMTAIMNSVPPAIGSMASALGALSRSLGMLTGMLLAGGALAAHVGEAQALERPKAVADALTTVFTVLAVTAALALAMSLRRSGPAAARSS